MSLLTLPTDLLLLILQHLDLSSLARLSLTCSALRSLIENYGWNIHLRIHPRSTKGLHLVQQSAWAPKYTLWHDALAGRNWKLHKFTARPLADPWQTKLHPIIALSKHRLFIAAGTVIEVFVFTRDGKIQFEGWCPLEGPGSSKGDITAFAVSCDDADAPLLVGFADGSVEQIDLVLPVDESRTIPCSRTIVTKLTDSDHVSECIQTVSPISNSQAILSLAADGTAVITQGSTSISSLNLLVRSWIAHIPHSTAYAAFGTSSSTPLRIHPMTPTGFTTVPPTTLSTSRQQPANAVYAIAPFPGHSSDQVIVSGWYDGVVRVHDMRSDARVNQGNGLSGLRPVLHAVDSWSLLPIYSLSTSVDSPQVAAGMAQHSLVAFWDIRYTKETSLPEARHGWSMHAPGNDPSPVYNLHLDGSSRLFGVTQHRPFVLDFGPDVDPSTYPPIDLSSQRLRRVRNNNLIKQGVGFYVTKYLHAKRRLDVH